MSDNDFEEVPALILGALTRPVYINGVVFEAFIFELVASVVGMAVVGNVLGLLAVGIPLHLINTAICSYDPHLYNVLKIAFLTKFSNLTLFFTGKSILGD